MSARRAHRLTSIVVALSLLAPSGALAQDDLPATLGASTPEFQDDLEEPGRWGLPDSHGSTTDTGGAITMTFDDAGWMWGWRDLAAAHHSVLRVEGSLGVEGDVSGGWMCGASESLFAFGIVDAEDGWRIGHIVDGTVTIDDEGSLVPRLAQVDGEPRVVSVECGQENVDITRLLLRVDGTSVGSANVGPLGPFDRVAFVGTSAAGDGAIRFEDIAAWSGTRYAPSDEAPATAGPAATLPVVDSVLGATTVAFEDDFSTPDRWGTGTAPEGLVSYADEQLAITILATDASRWSWRSVDDVVPVLRIEGRVTMDGDGSAGWMCGDASLDPSFLLAVTGASGSWSVGQIVGGAISVLERGTVPAGPPGDVPRHLTIECGDTTDARSRVLLWVDGELMADVTVDDPRGPFQRATAVAAVPAGASSPPFNARFDDVTVSVGAEDAPPE